MFFLVHLISKYCSVVWVIGLELSTSSSFFWFNKFEFRMYMMIYIYIYICMYVCMYVYVFVNVLVGVEFGLNFGFFATAIHSKFLLYLKKQSYF